MVEVNRVVVVMRVEKLIKGSLQVYYEIAIIGNYSED